MKKNEPRGYAIPLIAKAELIDSPVTVSDDVCQTIASAAGIESVDQADLLHIRSTFVTSGANENTDVFLKDELWKARKTPVHKPSNWDHKRTKIIGHMFNVEARTLDGELLDLEADEPTLASTGERYDGDFELIVDEVVYAFLLPEFAQEIKRRSKVGELFVSMEVWFSDFDIAVWSKPEVANKDRISAAATFEDAEFEIFSKKKNPDLVKLLKSSKGAGRTEDGKFVGRAMRNMLFGGKGFVALPGNPRSTIESVGGKPVNLISKSKVEGSQFKGTETFNTAQEDGDGWTHSFVVHTSIWDGEVFGVSISGEVKGNSSLEQATRGFTENIVPRLSRLGQSALEALKIEGEVESEARRKSVTQLESENRLVYNCYLDLVPKEMEPETEESKESSVLASANNQEVHMSADNAKLEERLEALQTEVEALRTENAELKSNSAVEAVKAEAAAREKKLDDVVQAFAAAPPEISRIDEVINRKGSADELWSAKIQWLFDTASKLTKTLADQSEALKGYRTKERMEQVKKLDIYSDEHLTRVEKQVADLDDKAFDDWLADKQVFADQKKEYAKKIADLESADDDDGVEDTEGDKAEAAEKALASAKPENKPEVTDAEESDPASAGSDDGGDIYQKLAQKLTDKLSPRQRRLMEKRKGFGQSI